MCINVYLMYPKCRYRYNVVVVVVASNPIAFAKGAISMENNFISTRNIGIKLHMLKPTGDWVHERMRLKNSNSSSKLCRKCVQYTCKYFSFFSSWTLKMLNVIKYDWNIDINCLRQPKTRVTWVRKQNKKKSRKGETRSGVNIFLNIHSDSQDLSLSVKYLFTFFLVKLKWTIQLC